MAPRARLNSLSSPASRLPTRALLECAAFASVHVLLHLASAPLLAALAPVAPPLYGLAAGLHSVMPFLARRITDRGGSATITSSIAALFVALSNGSGVIIVVPLVLAGVTIDIVVGRMRGDAARSRRRYLLAAVVTGTVLFAVSLLVFSPEHLTPFLIAATLAGRVGGELLAAAISSLVARRLWRSGVSRHTHDH